MSFPGAERGSMNEPNQPDPLSQLDERLKRLRRQEEAKKPKSSSSDRSNSGLNLAMRIGVELVAALIVGVGIGLLLDHWLGTKPWLMVVFFLLGAAAGFLNVYRVVSGMGGAVGYGRNKSKGGSSPPESGTE